MTTKGVKTTSADVSFNSSGYAEDVKGMTGEKVEAEGRRGGWTDVVFGQGGTKVADDGPKYCRWRLLSCASKTSVALSSRGIYRERVVQWYEYLKIHWMTTRGVIDMHDVYVRFISPEKSYIEVFVLIADNSTDK